jgi:hypothetical protein
MLRLATVMKQQRLPGPDGGGPKSAMPNSTGSDSAKLSLAGPRLRTFTYS